MTTILDGHSTHVSLKFIQEAENFRTLLLKFPSHSTHLLQPLDIALFLTLKDDCMGEISNWSSAGHNIVSKSAFLEIYGTIHDGAFTEPAQKNSFKAVGVHRFDPEMVLKRLVEKQQKLVDD